jgi:peptidyl-prolyl cis-trans isomerase A (cyclophilin A)
MLAGCALFMVTLTVAQTPPPVDAGAAPGTVPAPAVVATQPTVVDVLMHTALGDVTIALDEQRAPLTVKNFLRYVDLKRFDGITFYRVVRLDEEGRYGLVQGGLHGDPKRVLKPVAHEAPAATGLSHLDGAISMAHLTPGTATAEFFFVVGDLTSLDGNGTPENPGYAVFGRVTNGMDVIRAIMGEPRDPNAGEGMMKGQMLAMPVRILTMRRVP